MLSRENLQMCKALSNDTIFSACHLIDPKDATECFHRVNAKAVHVASQMQTMIGLLCSNQYVSMMDPQSRRPVLALALLFLEVMPRAPAASKFAMLCQVHREIAKEESKKHEQVMCVDIHFVIQCEVVRVSESGTVFVRPHCEKQKKMDSVI